jgi:iron-sulfur cluster assembly accessory protein
MINVTASAAKQLQSLLHEHGGEPEKGLRVQVAKGGCSGLQYEMLLDGRKADDAIVARDGVEFFVSADSADFLQGATLDFEDGLTGAGFRIMNPNAARTCGCGTSFEPARSA